MSYKVRSKQDDTFTAKKRCITDFYGGAGAGLEFAIVAGDPARFTIDTINTKHSTQSVKVSPIASESCVFGTSQIKTRDLTDFVSGRFWFFVSNASFISQLIVYGYTDTGVTSYSVTVPNIKDGWNIYSFNRCEFALNGSPTGWDAIQRWQFRVIATAGGSPSVSFDYLEFYNPSNTKPIAIVSLDDTHITAKTVAKPILDSFGFKATLFCTPSLVGSGANYMTVSDILAMQSDGFEIGAHGYDHTDYSTISSFAMRADIEKTLDFFDANGIEKPFSMAYPVGTAVGLQKELIASNYFKISRGTSNANVYDNLDSIPFGYPDHTRAIGMSAGSASVNAILEKILVTRGVAQLYAHDVSGSPTGIGTNTTDFTAIMQYLYDNDFQVMTYKEFVNSYLDFDLP